MLTKVGHERVFEELNVFVLCDPIFGDEVEIGDVADSFFVDDGFLF